MLIRDSRIQGVRLVGRELRETVEMRDCSRAPYIDGIDSKIELDASTFPKVFEDGQTVMLGFGDLTQGRINAQSRIGGLHGTDTKVFYVDGQTKPIIITIGTEYAKSDAREAMNYLSTIWNQDCGLYEVYWEVRVNSPIRNEKQSVA